MSITSKTTISPLAERLAAFINLQSRATEYVPDANPFASATVDDVAGTTGFPAVNMAAKINSTDMAFDLEAGVSAAREKGKDATVAKRVAQHRARAQKKVEVDRIEALPVPTDPERMELAWLVAYPLVPIVTKIAESKARWAERFLGSVTDDVAQVVLERMATFIARQDKFDLDVLLVASSELGALAKRSSIPGNQLSDDERKERKAIGKARKWLMGMINNRVQGTLADLYMEARHLRCDNVDIVATVIANINGVDGDPMLKAHLAARAPGFLGTRFQRPEGFDQGLIAQAVSVAITERGLDAMTEILLNEDNRRSNGSVAWSRIAEAVFKATPGVDGEGLWTLVSQATAHHKKPKKGRADAARTHVQNQFDWLPGFIVGVVNSMDPHVVGWAQQPTMPVRTAPKVGNVVTKVTDVRVIAGTGVIPSPNPAFDGKADLDGTVWPTTVGQPVGDAVATEFAEAEVVQMPWRFRQDEAMPCHRAEALLSSDFDAYLTTTTGLRQVIQPALTYATVEEAVEALTRHLDVLTGTDFITSINCA